jgi:uncharacterized membrane protein
MVDLSGQSEQATPAARGAGAAADRQRLVRQAELIISNVLRVGVLLSGAIIVVGVVAFYVRYGPAGGPARGRTFPHTLGAVGQGLAHGDPQAIITLGLLVLLATPFVRVAVSIVAFGLEHDWRYVAITTAVLMILVVSFLLGRGGA